MRQLTQYDAPGEILPAHSFPTGGHRTLPGDIRAERVALQEAMLRAEEISNEADGIWGPIGMDGLTGLIPGVGALYTLYTMLRLQGCAARARCGVGLRLTGGCLGLADMGIGVIVGAGDLVDFLFRSGAIFAGSIQRDIRRKLMLIEAAEDQQRVLGYLPDEDVARLRFVLFGRSHPEEGDWMPTMIAFVVVAILIYSFSG